MIVLKFGGSSLKNAAAFKNVGRLVRHYTNNPLLVVVSAWGKTTSRILEAAKLAEQNQTATAFSFIRSLKDDTYELVSHLFPGEFPKDSQLTALFDEMDSQMNKIHDLAFMSDELQDAVLSYGELITSLILEEYFRYLEFTSLWMDIRDILITDSAFGNAIPNKDKTLEKINEKIIPLFKKYNIIVTQGFIGNNDEGKTTTLGFEGSDYSAAFLANCLNAEKIILWKDVNGIMSGDPNLITQAKTIPKIDYDDISLLSKLGAKVVHPRSILPAKEKNINIEVKNFRYLKKEFTLITKLEKKEFIPAVAYQRDLLQVRIFDDEECLESHLKNYNIPYLLYTKQSKYCSFFVSRDGLNERKIETLNRKYVDLKIQPGYGSISIINSNKTEMELTDFLKKCEYFNWWSCYFLSDQFITIILYSDELIKGMNLIHDWLFKNTDYNL